MYILPQRKKERERYFTTSSSFGEIFKVMASQKAMLGEGEIIKRTSCKYQGRKCLFKIPLSDSQNNIFYSNRCDSQAMFHLDYYLLVINKYEDGELLKIKDDTTESNKYYSFVERNVIIKKRNKKN